MQAVKKMILMAAVASSVHMDGGHKRGFSFKRFSNGLRKLIPGGGKSLQQRNIQTSKDMMKLFLAGEHEKFLGYFHKDFEGSLASGIVPGGDNVRGIDGPNGMKNFMQTYKGMMDVISVEDVDHAAVGDMVYSTMHWEIKLKGEGCKPVKSDATVRRVFRNGKMIGEQHMIDAVRVHRLSECGSGDATKMPQNAVNAAMAVTCPKKLEDKVENLWKMHAAWMRETHVSSGPKEILFYHVTKSDELEDPTKGEASAKTGNVVFNIVENYSQRDGLDNHMAMFHAGHKCGEFAQQLMGLISPKEDGGEPDCKFQGWMYGQTVAAIGHNEFPATYDGFEA